MSQAQRKISLLDNVSSEESTGDVPSSSHPSHMTLVTGISALRNSFQPHANSPNVMNLTTTKQRRELDYKENVDPMSFAPKKKKTPSATMSVPGRMSFNECSGDARSPAEESSRVESASHQYTQQQGDSRKRSRIGSGISKTTETSDELVAKSQADLMSFAPRKKSLSSKATSCRIGNMIVKRNSWNLSFEPLRMLSPQPKRSPVRVTDSSVYDFN